MFLRTKKHDFRAFRMTVKLKIVINQYANSWLSATYRAIRFPYFSEQRSTETFRRHADEAENTFLTIVKFII